jgi:hypothetical protein
MKPKKLLMTMLAAGSLSMLPACAGSPLGPDGLDEVSHRQTLDEPIIDPAPHLPALPGAENPYR